MKLHGAVGWKGLAAEFFVVVAGILVALAVDGWRQEREELRVANEHLSDLAAEVHQNLWTIDRVLNMMLKRKRAALETVLAFLNDPDAPVTDVEQLLMAFAQSATSATPWLSDAQFQSLRDTGDLRLLRDPGFASDISGAYAAPEVLLSQVARMQGNYPAVVNGLIPAYMQPEVNSMRGYMRKAGAPPIKDPTDANAALAEIRARRSELLSLARSEAAVATAQWYAVARLKSNFEDLLKSLAPWDHAGAASALPKQ
jgi:hypothetical protein